MITEDDEFYELCYAGLLVSDCTVSPETRIIFKAKTSGWILSMNAEFLLRRAISSSESAALASLVGIELSRLRVSKKDGRLKAEFSNGSVLIVMPDPDYEAWQLTSDTGTRLLAVPGDGLAFWS